MFIEPHFVGISPTQLTQRTGGPQQQGFINNYKVICFCVKINWMVFPTQDANQVEGRRCVQHSFGRYSQTT